jgi:hypothetical protein
MAQDSKRIIEELNSSNKPAPLARFELIGTEYGSSKNIETDDYCDGGVF